MLQRDGLLFFRHDLPVPLYVYRCSTCGAAIEELQKLGADAPDSPSDPSECLGQSGGVPTCDLVRQLTTATHRFSADYTSDGIGGYERQGETMIRQVPGKNSMTYGTDRSGRD